MPEENEALTRRWTEEVFNQRRLDVAEEIYAPDHVLHDPATRDLPRGPEGMKQFARIYHEAFPDARLTIEDIFSVGDRVAFRWTGHGTNHGELMGMAPTGRSVTVPGISIERVADGRIAETWFTWDNAGLMQQLGAAPPPGSRGERAMIAAQRLVARRLRTRPAEDRSKRPSS